MKLNIRNDIQCLRGVAVLGVIAFHSGLPLNGGFLGVDIFFVISGYVITEILIRQQALGKFNILDFYMRRFMRLIPALSTMISIVLLLGILIISPLKLANFLKQPN